MNTGTTQLGVALLSGPLLMWLFGPLLRLWRRVRGDPKAEAEARKINAEADETIEGRLWREIKRLDGELADVRTELAGVKREAATEKYELEHENKRLRFEVSSLRRRVSQLEEIIKLKTTPEDMRAQLAKLDRKTSNAKD